MNADGLIQFSVEPVAVEAGVPNIIRVHAHVASVSIAAVDTLCEVDLLFNSALHLSSLTETRILHPLRRAPSPNFWPSSRVLRRC